MKHGTGVAGRLTAAAACARWMANPGGRRAEALGRKSTTTTAAGGTGRKQGERVGSREGGAEAGVWCCLARMLVPIPSGFQPSHNFHMQEVALPLHALPLHLPLRVGPPHPSRRL